MHVAFDAVMLSVYLHPGAKPPKPVSDLPARIQLLVDELEAAGAKVIIPTPVLSEFLVLTGPKDGASYLSDLSTSEVFDIKPFDTMAAIEASEMQRKAMTDGDKKAGSAQRWQVVKVDRQFVAIAKVNGVSVIYSDDDDVRKMAESVGIACKGVLDLPAPPAPDPQQPLAFDGATALPSTESEQPDEQSPGDGTPKDSPPAPGRPSGPQAVPKPRQQDSSPPPSPSPRAEPPKR
jgi:predicted nucleic acid-binding protein